MPIIVAIIIGVVLAIGGTITAFILIIPEKKKAGLNKFLLFLHDLFNFKTLWLEAILRAMYVFSTLFCIGGGFFMLFSWKIQWDWYGNRISGKWNGLSGLAMLILGPIIVRIAYEGVMMMILLVKNTIEINKKLGSKAAAVSEAAPPPSPSPTPKMVFCTFCGTRYDANQGGCPKGCKG